MWINFNMGGTGSIIANCEDCPDYAALVVERRGIRGNTMILHSIGWVRIVLNKVDCEVKRKGG